jgi:hypothetical protein
MGELVAQHRPAVVGLQIRSIAREEDVATEGEGHGAKAATQLCSGGIVMQAHACGIGGLLVVLRRPLCVRDLVEWPPTAQLGFDRV